MIDVRWAHEVEGRPSVFRDSDEVRYRNMPLMPDEAVPDGIAATYRHMFDTRSTALAGIARALVEPEGLPAVIGCAAGVDRTGVTVALLLSAVGVPAEVVAADYALSVESFATDGAASGLADWRGGPVTLDCQPEYMFEALDHLERVHGGAPALLARTNGFRAIARTSDGLAAERPHAIDRHEADLRHALGRRDAPSAPDRASRSGHAQVGDRDVGRARQHRGSGAGETAIRTPSRHGPSASMAGDRSPALRAAPP